MGNISKSNLQDKDIRGLEIRSSRYIKAVGNPKKLYIFVYPSGMKTFMVKYNDKYMKIKEFRENIYSVAEARRDVIKILKELENGKDIVTVKGQSPKYLYYKEHTMKKFEIVNDEYITPEQFQNKYGISVGVQTKMRMRKNRDKFCDFLKIGRAILYKQSDVDEWLNRQKVSNN